MDEDYTRRNHSFTRHLIAVPKSQYCKYSKYIKPEISKENIFEVTETQLLSLVGLTDEDLQAIIERKSGYSNKGLIKKILDREKLWRNHSLIASLIAVGGNIIKETKDVCRIPKEKYENPAEFIREFTNHYQKNHHKEGGILFR